MSNFDELDLDGIAHELDNGGYVVDNPSRVTDIVDAVPPATYQDPLQAEFARLRRAAQKAGISDEFYQLLEARLDRMRSLNSQTGFVGNPPSAADKRLGGSVILTSDTKVVQASVARWQGIDEENGPVTICAGPATPLGVGTNVVRPFLYVRWGTYGYNFTAEVDLGTGRQFTVNASMVEVELALDALSASNSQQVQMAAYMGFRPVVRTAPLIRTRYIDSATQNTANTVVVPPFATGLLPIQMSDAAGTVTLDFYDTSNTIRYTLTVAGGTQLTAIPLAGDIVQVVVTSTGASTQHIRLPFELSI